MASVTPATRTGTATASSMSTTARPATRTSSPARCAAEYGGNAHQCTRAELEALNDWAMVCANNNGNGHVTVNDGPRWQDGYGWYYQCRTCNGGAWAQVCNGQPVHCCL